MPERIDHARSAASAVDRARNLWNTHEDQAAAAMATIALTEATLALVEQQRIANLIALAQVRVGPDDFPPFRGLVMELTDDGHGVRPTERIREGLGL